MPGSSQGGEHATDAVRTIAQQDAMEVEQLQSASTRYIAREEHDYRHGPNLFRPTRFLRYERKPEDPLYRPLQIYTVDPVRSGYEGSTVVVSVPYEPLAPGPVGSLLEVDDRNADPEKRGPVDLEDRALLLQQGCKASSSDFRFHEQMVYAVCSDIIASFTVALGRDLSWGFERPGTDTDRLVLRPHFAQDRNAYYDKVNGELKFGYFDADSQPGVGVLPRGKIYTCLSHDIVAHEMAHALLDGLRARFDNPTNPDVLAFHEAFADLIAILQHFSHRDTVREAIMRNGGRLGEGGTIYSVAEQFGLATGLNRPLRVALDRAEENSVVYGVEREPHVLGTLLTEAVLEAMGRVFERRAEPMRTLHALSAVQGAGLHPAYRDALAELAAKTASQFMALCIRAVDYCPPVDITFGEYLRALITADRDLVEDDRYHFRQELIAAFGRRHIFPEDVADLSEASLMWNTPKLMLPEVPGLSFANLRLRGDPGQSPDQAEIAREAGALADLVTDPKYREEFGLVASDKDFELPVIESIRILRRIGPDRQVRFGLIAEVLQAGRVQVDGHWVEMVGGSTIILGGRGETRFVIRKAVNNIARAQRRLEFSRSKEGKAQLAAAGTGETWARLHGTYCCGDQPVERSRQTQAQGGRRWFARMSD